MTLVDLCRYDAWAFEKLTAACGGLSPEEFAAEPSGKGSSVRFHLAHPISAMDRYRARIVGEPVPDYDLSSLESANQMQDWSAPLIFRFGLMVEELPESDLTRTVDHATRVGVYRMTVEETIRHVLNHGTYHRGQVAALLRASGRDFPDTDLLFWVVEGSAPAL